MQKSAASRKPERKFKSDSNHYRIHKERPFLYEERESTTVLLGGLSPTHDYLFEAAMKGIGIKAKALPSTNLDAFHLGKEYGNNGYCNPAYFTVGNLIRFLKDLEASGESKKDIIEHYVFFTAGCNAPCRFGMLETEYRMALKDCGFDGFRILVFQNEGGLSQKGKGKGLEVNPEFFLAIVNAFNMADAVNDLVYDTRPFEVIKGQTDEVKDKAIEYLYNKLKNKKRIELRGFWAMTFKALKMTQSATFIYRFLDQLYSSYYTNSLKKIDTMFQEVELDRFKSKTTVKITGEFWAITTVGAGNFNIFHFLEREGAIIRIEPVASLIQFLFSKGMLRHRNRRKLILANGINSGWQIRKRLKNFVTFQKKLKILQLGNYLFRREYKRLLKALGGDYHMLLEQAHLQKIAQPYYNINIEGGEGYMEVAKNIYYHKHKLCHMVLSLKPFGCMPSTQSDGAQAAVIEHHPDIIYLPLETAGDGETNAQSRVLMSLGDARVIAKQEFANARKQVKSTMDEMKDFVEDHPDLKKPAYVVPQYNGTTNRAANFIFHVDHLIQKKQNA